MGGRELDGCVIGGVVGVEEFVGPVISASRGGGSRVGRGGKAHSMRLGSGQSARQ